MREISPQRRNVVLVACAVACMGGVTPLLMHFSRGLGWVWIAMMAAGLVYAVVMFSKLQGRSDG